MYLIQVIHNNQVLASVKAGLPDLTSIYLSELINSVSPGYTGG